MRTTFAIWFCGLSLALGAVPALAAPGPSNANWYPDPADQANLVFWVSSKAGSCDENRKSARPLVIVTKSLKAGASSGSLQATELARCFVFLIARDPKGDNISRCGSGNVELSFDAAANAYQGKYDLTMKNAEVRRGEFRAQFCKPSEPAKK